MATVAAPADYAELFREYYPYVSHLVRKMGIPAQEADDTASDILARLMERDVIGMFDPGYQIEHRGKQVEPNFRTFLSTQVSLYVRGKRDALGRRAKRELLLCDQPAESGTSSWAELFGGGAWDDYSHLSVDEFVARMRGYLASLPPRTLQDRCDLVRVFDVLVAQITDKGHISYPDLRERFSLSVTGAYTWVSRLREALAQAPASAAAVPPPLLFPVAGMALTATDMQDAIAVLKSPAGGIMVRQPLVKAGHKLAQAPDAGWYHAFAAAERKVYPELEIDPQTHKKPAGHVRLAVVHRLERMLAEAVAKTEGEARAWPGGCLPLSPPPPPEPDTPEDLLEAELWRLGADPVTVDKIKDLARVAFTAG